MPHKVNPIQFENAEGNLGVAIALFEFFARKLPISRFQRDLTDSTVLRNIGVAFGHTALALHNISKGLEYVTPDVDEIEDDLEKHWEVVTEAIQTALRAKGDDDAYERVKQFTRECVAKKGCITALDVQRFAEKEGVCQTLTPFTYLTHFPE